MSNDGKIFIIPVEDAFRIRTEETGEKARWTFSCEKELTSGTQYR